MLWWQSFLVAPTPPSSASLAGRRGDYEPEPARGIRLSDPLNDGRLNVAIMISDIGGRRNTVLSPSGVAWQGTLSTNLTKRRGVCGRRRFQSSSSGCRTGSHATTGHASPTRSTPPTSGEDLRGVLDQVAVVDHPRTDGERAERRRRRLVAGDVQAPHAVGRHVHWLVLRGRRWRLPTRKTRVHLHGRGRVRTRPRSSPMMEKTMELSESGTDPH